MAQRLIVADALHRPGDRLFVQDAALAEGDRQPKTALQQPLQNFQLHFAHQLHMHLGQVVAPGHVQLRVLVLQRAQRAQQCVRVGGGAAGAVVQHRFQQRGFGVGLGPQALAGARAGRAGHRHHHAGLRGAHQPELAAVVQPQRVGFLAAGQHGFYRQRAAGHLQPGQPRAGVVLADLEHPRAKLRPGGRHARQRLQRAQQLVQALQAQRRAKKAGEHLPPRNGLHQRGGARRAGGQHFLHQRFAAQCQRLGVGRGGKVYTAVAKTAAQLPQAHGGVGPRQVHLVHKHKRRHAVARQQLPQRLGVGLHAVGAADHQHRVVQHLQGALGLGRKIHMPRRVQQRQLGLLGSIGRRQRQHGLLGKNRDAPRTLLRVGVQKGVAVVHPAQLAQRARAVQQPLGQRGLAAVHMGQQAHDQTFHSVPLCCVQSALIVRFLRPGVQQDAFSRKK